MRPLFRPLWLASVALASAAADAAADERTWIQPNGGSFSSSSNWQGGTVPGSSDIAVFGLHSSYQVMLDAAAITKGFRLSAGELNLNLSGFSYSLIGNSSPDVFSIGGHFGTKLTLSGGVLEEGTLTGGSWSIGGGKGSSGEVIVTGAGTSVGLRDAVLSIGQAGDGRLTIANGATLSDTVVGGRSATVLVGPTGRLDVTGASSVLNVRTGQILSGGSVAITGGGRATAETWSIGEGSSVLLSGPGSRLIAQLGISSHGQITVEDGALIESSSPSVSLQSLSIFGPSSRFNSSSGATVTADSLGVFSGGIFEASRFRGTAVVSAPGSRLNVRAGLSESNVSVSSGGILSTPEILSSTVAASGQGSRVEMGSVGLIEGDASTRVSLANNAHISAGALIIATEEQFGALSLSSGATGSADLLVAGVSGGTASVSIDAGSSFTTGEAHFGGFPSLVGGQGFLSLDGSMNANAVHIHSGSVVTGGGSVVGSLISGGIVAPGAGIGTLSVTGDYLQQSTGELIIDLGELNSLPAADHLAISGSAVLSGDLILNLSPTFDPAVGSTFTIVSASSLSFAGEVRDLPTLSGGRSIEVVTDASALRLVVIPAPPAVLPFAAAALLVAGRRRRLRDPRLYAGR